MIKVLLALCLFLAGCSEAYRYPCQDPRNWDSANCQKPYCSANGTCPEDLAHYLKKSAPATPPVAQGVCK